MKPGIYPHISNSQYHAGPGLSSSALKKLLLSGAHYQASLARPLEQTKEMVLGSLVHSLILEPEKVEQEYFIGEFNVRRGKEYENALREAGTRTVVSKEDFERAMALVEAFRIQALDHPDLNGTTEELLKGDKEHSYYWEDRSTGILCKCRPDNITPSGILVDVKSTKNAGFDSFQKDIVTYGYYLSAAFYLRGVEAVTGIAPKSFVIIAIETEAPFLVQIYKFGPLALEIGARHVNQALETFAEGVSTEIWQGYPKKVIELELPNWAMFRLNKE